MNKNTRDAIRVFLILIVLPATTLFFGFLFAGGFEEELMLINPLSEKKIIVHSNEAMYVNGMQVQLTGKLRFETHVDYYDHSFVCNVHKEFIEYPVSFTTEVELEIPREVVVEVNKHGGVIIITVECGNNEERLPSATLESSKFFGSGAVYGKLFWIDFVDQ